MTRFRSENQTRCTLLRGDIVLYIGDKTPERCYFNGKRVSGIYSGEILLWPPVYTVTVSIDPSGAGTVTGAGQYKEGESVTIRAVPGDGYKFTGWRENGTTVSTNEAYTFTVTGNRTFIAAFEVDIVNFGWTASNCVAVCVCYGNARRFVAVNGQNAPKYSDDGITWKTSAWGAGASASGSFGICAYGNSTYIALAGQYTQYSSSGTAWNHVSYTSPNVGKTALSSDGTHFVCYPGYVSTNMFYISDNGKSWSVFYGSHAKAMYRSGTYGAGKFVAAGYNTATAFYYIYGSQNTVQTSLPVSAYWISMTYGAGKFVVIAYNSNHAAYSTDGITWKGATLPGALKWTSVAYGDGKFVAIADSSNKVAYSRDGVTWRFANDVLPGAWSWKNITYGGNKFVAVGSNGSAYSTLSS